MPKIFTHILTEIKILFRCREKEEQKAAENIINNLVKKITDLHLQNEQNKKHSKENYQETIRLQELNDELLKKIKKL